MVGVVVQKRKMDDDDLGIISLNSCILSQSCTQDQKG